MVQPEERQDEDLDMEQQGENFEEDSESSYQEKREEKPTSHRHERHAHGRRNKARKIEIEHPVRSKKSRDEETVKISKSTVFGILAIIFLGLFLLSIFTNVFGNQVGAAKKMSDTEVKNKVLGAVESIQPGLDPQVSNIKQLSDGTYEFTLVIQGQPLTSYLSPDGSLFFPQGFEAPKSNNVITGNVITGNAGNAAPADLGIQKTDVPQVELFVWSYCPYGVQAQGPLAEVVELLGDTAEFRIVQFHDGHGPYEKQQNMIQLCIQKLEPEKYWKYASEFVQNIYPKCNPSRDVKCDEVESIKLMNSLEINAESVFNCVETDGEDLLLESRQKAQANAVTGSPTLIVNGAKVQVARSAEAFKSAICSAYTNPPAECQDVVLDSNAAVAAGNC